MELQFADTYRKTGIGIQNRIGYTKNVDIMQNENNK